MTESALHCIYASTSGNVETVVETAAKVLQEQGWQTELHRAEKTGIDLITQNSKFLLATSTWEHGALNPFFAKLFKEMSSQDLTGKQAAFIGLGDSRYEPVLFCEGMEIVKRMWEARGGQVIGIPLKINGEPYKQLETKVVPWANHLVKTWTTVEPTGLQKIINSVFPHA
jgi:flavodoxin